MFKIAASLMCANSLRLEEDVRELDRAGIDLFHIDVMDGHFVPNLALNTDVVRQLRRISTTPADVHLMVDNPEQYLGVIEALEIPWVSFHVEATRQPIRLSRAVRAAGAKVGVALNPATPPELLEYVADEIDYVLLMTVEPGFAGQKFIPVTLDKIRRIRRMLDARRPDVEIEVDGNLTVEMASRCVAAGASILVAGTSSLFRAQSDLYTACVEFRERVRSALAEASVTG